MSSSRYRSPRAFSLSTILGIVALTSTPFFLTTACSSEDSDGPGDPDVDPIAWVSPGPNAEVQAGDLIPLTAKVNDPNGSIVEFMVDGKVLDRCDTSKGPRECRRDDLFRIVTTFQQTGPRHLVARYLSNAGYKSATLNIVVVAGTTPPDPNQPENPPTSKDAGTTPSDAGNGSDDGGTPPPTGSDRGFLDPDRPLHNVFGGVSWAVKGQRVEVADALTTPTSQIASCMNTYGASIIKHADANKISRASVIATAITESNCTNPAGSSDGLSSGPMQVTGYTCRALFPGRFGSDAACTQEMHNKPDFSFEAGCKVMGEAYAVKIHDHDPPKIAAQYNAGSVKQSSANRWHMVVTGNHIDRFVAAYNAYRAWESMNGVAQAKLAGEVSGWAKAVFDGENVRQAGDLPVVAKEGQVYFVGDWEKRDGQFMTYRQGRWQLH